ncbi:substrate-binding periplasmic protein [Deefgea rivuli]|uniref:substrate-binding periplasmic protein n=1 Tax=Deefgea rivuli TaxID=400948 RepID=UPI00068412F5|nr:transporter substrate-binding domain-containing protein [Deefgea rivuli]
MKILASLLGLCLLSAPVYAEKITLTLQEYPPYMGEKLPFQGLLTRIVVSAFALENIEVVLKSVPNNRAIEAPRRGIYDGSFGWAKNADRERDLLYTDPVMSLRMVFCHQKGQQFPWKTLADLSPYAIGITSGNYYSEDFAKLQAAGVLKVDAAHSDVANFKKLLAGYIQLFPIDAEVAPYLMAQHLTPVERVSISCQKEAYWDAPLHVVVYKKHPNAERWVKAFNAGLNTLEKSGQLERLIQSSRDALYQVNSTK